MHLPIVKFMKYAAGQKIMDKCIWFIQLCLEINVIQCIFSLVWSQNISMNNHIFIYHLSKTSDILILKINIKSEILN